MNAPNFLSPAKSHLMANPSREFLKNLSLEITARQIEKLPVLQERLPKGTPVFIALIDPRRCGGPIDGGKRLAQSRP